MVMMMMTKMETAIAQPPVLAKEVGGADLSRINYGVLLRDRGTIQASASIWYHHFVVKMPSIDDVIPVNCIRHLHKNMAIKNCNSYDNDNDSFASVLNKQLVDEFKQIRKSARRNLNKLTSTDATHRNKRSAPLGFIGDLSKSLFGTARMEDLELVARRVNAWIARGQGIGKALTQHEQNFESYMKVNSKRYDDLKHIVEQNHYALKDVINATRELKQTVEFNRRWNLDNIKRMNSTLLLTIHLWEINEAIRALSRGVFPQVLVSDNDIRQADRSIAKVLKKKHPSVELLHPEADCFHQNGPRFIAHLGKDADIWITLKFQVGPRPASSKLYNIKVYPVPVNNGSTHATKIKGLPEYVVIKSTVDNQISYAPITAAELSQCTLQGSYTCDFALAFAPLNDGSCVAAINQDKPDLIQDSCRFAYLRDHITPGFVPISDNTVLFYDIKDVTLLCRNNPPTQAKGCHFCIFDVQCNCQLVYNNHYDKQTSTCG